MEKYRPQPLPSRISADEKMPQVQRRPGMIDQSISFDFFANFEQVGLIICAQEAPHSLLEFLDIHRVVVLFVFDELFVELGEEV